jgi:diaminopimelate decarboxylase
MVNAMRNFLVEKEFIEIHTPKLIGAASETGSEVFKVKYFDRDAYLAQSPQFYKQMAMASGFDKIFEVGPVFRAEKSYTSKHTTEFTGFDLEFSYIESFEDVMVMEEEMIAYTLKEIKDKFLFECKILNLGGGFGIRYVDEDAELDIDECIKNLASVVKAECKSFGVAEPEILMEPGRSIVGDCGITLYTIGSIKEITGYKKYVAIDGGMSDNPRYALYSSPYTAVVANKAIEDKNFLCTIAGKCCESGDLIQEDTYIQTPASGDILAVLSTGAYNYSMASNYNKIPRPPIVMIKGGEDYVAVKRETYEDLARNEI